MPFEQVAEVQEATPFGLGTPACWGQCTDQRAAGRRHGWNLHRTSWSMLEGISSARSQASLAGASGLPPPALTNQMLQVGEAAALSV